MPVDHEKFYEWGGQAPVIHLMPKLYEMIREDTFDPTDILTHTMPLDKAAEAYEIFDQKKIIILK